MKKKIYLLGLLIIALVVAASSVQPSVGLYWTSNADPTQGGGVAGAPLWQLLIRTDSPSLYYKSGASAVSWTPIGGSVSVPTFNATTAGKVPASGSDSTAVLYASGTWAPLPAQVTPSAWFGAGTDGFCNYDGVSSVLGVAPTGSPPKYVLNRSITCSSMNVSSNVTVDPDSYIIEVNGPVTLDGKIAYIANNGGNGQGFGSPGGGGAGRPTSGSRPLFGSSAGGGGSGPGGGGATSSAQNGLFRPCPGASVALPGTTPAQCQGGPGGKLDNGGATLGGGGAATLVNNVDAHMATLSDIYVAQWLRTPDNTLMSTGTAGGGGGGGVLAGCGGGGGGGASGGPVIFKALGPITGSGSIEAKGGNGGDGAQTGCTGCGNPGEACSAAGGGGGAGGVIVELIGTGNFPTSSVAGGTHGISGPGNSQTPAKDGGSGVLLQIAAGVQ